MFGKLVENDLRFVSSMRDDKMFYNTMANGGFIYPEIRIIMGEAIDTTGYCQTMYSTLEDVNMITPVILRNKALHYAQLTRLRFFA